MDMSNNCKSNLLQCSYKTETLDNVLDINSVKLEEPDNEKCDVKESIETEAEDLLSETTAHESEEKVAEVSSIKCKEIDIKYEELVDNRDLPVGGSATDFSTDYGVKGKRRIVFGHNCNYCRYRTKRARDMKRHIVVHKKAEEVIMFQCKICPFKSKWRETIYKHNICHKKGNQELTYHCTVCTYQTLRKSNIINHELVHKNPETVELFSCNLCSYQSKWKTNLREHMKSHEIPKEIYKCSLCSYETWKKVNYRQHQYKIHSLVKEQIWFQCFLCKFKTKWKNSLINHIKRHNAEKSGKERT